MMADMALSELTERLSEAMPVAMDALAAAPATTGLVIVDEINGFAAVGGGNLAPPVPNPQVAQMIAETDRLARLFTAAGAPILAFTDHHEPGKAEPPYPPHCEAGTGEEELVDELKWLEDDPHTTIIRKDCINGFVGAANKDGGNRFVDWVNGHGIETLVVVGICTDICVMDFVLTTLSARNHEMTPTLDQVCVYERGCATFDLPRATAEQLGYGATAAHPQDVTHYMGLYFMASRGARIVDQVSLTG